MKICRGYEVYWSIWHELEARVAEVPDDARVHSALAGLVVAYKITAGLSLSVN